MPVGVSADDLLVVEEQVPELLGGQVVKLCLEGEGLGGDGLVGGVVVGGEGGVGEGLLHVEAGGGVEAEEAVQDGAEVLVARAPVQDIRVKRFVLS